MGTISLINMESNQSPTSINHIAISVPDLDTGFNWYQEVMGFTIVRGPAELTYDDIHVGNALRNIFGSEFKRLRIVWMTSANSIGIELFQFIQPEQLAHKKQVEYWHGGVIHIAVTERNIEALLEKVTKTGGRQLSNIWELDPKNHHKLVFCSDPFGNIIEIYSHSFDQFHANR
jgi:catechol 2,3-dioxygenase-like lactoylglutathione lyase family enzyme